MVKLPKIQLTMISFALMGMVTSLLFFYFTLGIPASGHTAELHTKRGNDFIFQQFLSEESELESGEKSQDFQKAGYILFFLSFTYFFLIGQKSPLHFYSIHNQLRLIFRRNPIYLENRVFRN